MNIGVILAGGVGSRFGGNIPKQFHKINGREIISYSISALKESKKIEDVVVVSHQSELERLENEYSVKAICGGSSRNGSLKNALEFINSNYDCQNVIVLEAARPMMTAQLVDEYIEKLNEYDSVITGQHIVDSLGCYHSHTANRADFYLIQAPEAFNFKMLYECFDENSPLTATCQQMPEDSKLYINFNFMDNHKVTYQNDIKYCEWLLNK